MPTLSFVSGLNAHEWNCLKTKIPQLPELTAESATAFQIPADLGESPTHPLPKDHDLLVVQQSSAGGPSVLWDGPSADWITDILALSTLTKGLLVNVAFRVEWGSGSVSYMSDVRERYNNIGLYDIWMGTGASVVARGLLAIAKLSPTDKETWGIVFRWFYQAMRAQISSPTNMAMSLNWIPIEILGLRYVRDLGLQGKVIGKAKRVRRMLADKGYDESQGSWLDDRLKYWYDVRNDTFHEGVFNQDLNVLMDRRNELTRFSCAFLLDELGVVSDRQRLLDRVESGDHEDFVR